MEERQEMKNTPIGADTFGLNKTQFTEKLGRIIKNFRANSKLVSEPKDFVLRCCRLTEKWGKLANDPETVVYLKNIDTAGGRRVKMLVLERGSTKQPVPKQKLIDALYPPKKTATTATPEEKHYNNVKSAMRSGISYQLRAFRDGCRLPCICPLTGKKIRPGVATDIDHVGMTFSEICDEFVREKCLNYSRILLCGPPTAKRFKDEVLWQQWVGFHLEKAKYALTLASANRSKGCGNYCTPAELIGSFSKEDPEDLALDF
jgi:hypothetical protein